MLVMGYNVFNIYHVHSEMVLCVPGTCISATTLFEPFMESCLTGGCDI